MPLAYRIGTGASMDRLESLIEERLKPGADAQKIDSRIWDLFGEEWAVMFTDLSGFSRQVAEFGIIHFLQMIYESHRLLAVGNQRLQGSKQSHRRLGCENRIQQNMGAWRPDGRRDATGSENRAARDLLQSSQDGRSLYDRGAEIPDRNRICIC